MVIEYYNYWMHGFGLLYQLIYNIHNCKNHKNLENKLEQNKIYHLHNKNTHKTSLLFTTVPSIFSCSDVTSQQKQPQKNTTITTTNPPPPYKLVIGGGGRE